MNKISLKMLHWKYINKIRNITIVLDLLASNEGMGIKSNTQNRFILSKNQRPYFIKDPLNVTLNFNFSKLSSMKKEPTYLIENYFN